MATNVTDESPWEIARNRFLLSLDPDEQVLFKEATIDNIFNGTSELEKEDKVNSKTRKAIKAIQPLVGKIEEYGRAMDTYANASPLVLGPIWGSLRVVLIVARSLGRFYEKMTDTLGRIGDILPRFFVSLKLDPLDHVPNCLTLSRNTKGYFRARGILCLRTHLLLRMAISSRYVWTSVG